MAKKMNFWLRGKVGRLAGTTIYKANGVTRQREIVAPSNPRTNAQMSQRTKLANLVNFYRVSKPWMAKAFEGKRSTQSDYNMLVKLNLALNPVALTKGEAAAAACVVAPYQVSQGSLAPITLVFNQSDNAFVTNIRLGAIEEGANWGAISAAIIEANAGIVEGMQLSFIRYTQMQNEDSATPYVIMRKYEAIIDTTSAKQMSDFFPEELVTIMPDGDDLALAVVSNNNDGGFALVWSHTVGGKIRVSSQFVQMVGTTTLRAYTTGAQTRSAIESYGTSGEVFLDSKTIMASNNGGSSNSILLRTALGYTTADAAIDATNWVQPGYGQSWSGVGPTKFIAIKLAKAEPISRIGYALSLDSQIDWVTATKQVGLIVAAPGLTYATEAAKYLLAESESGNIYTFAIVGSSQGGDSGEHE